MESVSIILPAYNEKECILEEVRRLIDLLESSSLTFELIVVDDGSTDGTGEILEKAELNIKLIHHEFNKGYGAALKTGVRNASYDTIVITDADGTYPNEMIPELVSFSDTYDMVVGSRTAKNVKIPLLRRPAKWVITKLANYLSECKIPDLNSGLRVIKKHMIDKFFNLLPDRFSFTSTISLAMLVNGYSVKYVAIEYRKRTGRSKIRPIRDTLNFFQLIIRTVMYFRPLKVFVPLSLLLLLIGVGVFVYSAVFTEKIMDATVVAVSLSAVQVLAIGMIADLIDKRMRK
jgi:glycosyltransferase involved in cell wall biosynthesis